MATPRSQRDYFHANALNESTNKVWRISASKNNRKAHKQTPVKKKHLGNYTPSSMEIGISNSKEDPPRTRYEALRRNYLLEIPEEDSCKWVRFGLFGLSGLLQPTLSRPYILEVHQANSPRWCGRTDPQEKTLLEVFKQLASHSTQAVFQN
jgi:hypothetical protein